MPTATPCRPIWSIASASASASKRRSAAATQATIGYCVRVHDVPPLRTVKSITRVLDDEVLLTDSLLRLTRWMADYYLCGWGQVLQAVLPAGVRDQAGTREAIFVEAVPESELPTPLPPLTAKQSQALDRLRESGGPVEQRQLCRDAKVGPGIVRSLIDKGLARKHVERVERTRHRRVMPTPCQRRRSR